MLYRLPWSRACELLSVISAREREAAKARDENGRELSLREQLMAKLRSRK